MSFNPNYSSIDDEPSDIDQRIFFVAILRNEETLVKYAQLLGNYDQILSQVLHKIIKKNDTRMTFNYEKFCFHYIFDNTLTYFCITRKVFDQVKAFKFLARIKNKFESQYQQRVHTALPFAFHAEFLPTLAIETKRYSENLSFEKINEIQEQIDETRQILCEDIDRLVDRGESLHLLVDKSDQMTSASISFKQQSRNLSRRMYWKHIRVIVGFFLLSLLVVYLIIAFSCGGFLWPKCV